MLALAGCGAPDPHPTASPSGDLTVFAAASLTATFTQLGEQFEAANPGSAVRFSFDGSPTLVTQILQGAPADVFAAADAATMDQLADAAVDPRDFATNRLQIAVPRDNPANITSLADLAQPGLKLVLCAPQVPCGAATQRVAEAAGVALSPVSLEPSVTDVLGKVRTGEADAGVVYRTDVQGGGDAVWGIEFPEAAAVVNTYPIAVLRDSDNPELAQTFVDFVLGEAGQSALAQAGFTTPAAP
jgi:molybdate transport system substrate-binding protein